MFRPAEKLHEDRMGRSDVRVLHPRARRGKLCGFPADWIEDTSVTVGTLSAYAFGLYDAFRSGDSSLALRAERALPPVFAGSALPDPGRAFRCGAPRPGRVRIHSPRIFGGRFASRRSPGPPACIPSTWRAFPPAVRMLDRRFPAGEARRRRRPAGCFGERSLSPRSLFRPASPIRVTSLREFRREAGRSPARIPPRRAKAVGLSARTSGVDPRQREGYDPGMRIVGFLVVLLGAAGALARSLPDLRWE